MKLYKLNEAATVSATNNTVNLIAVADPQIGKSTDNTPVVVYQTGVGVEIPEGYVGILVANEDLVKTSLSLLNGVQVYKSGDTGELVLFFRLLCGNAFPSLYKKDEVIGKLIIVKTEDFSIEIENTYENIQNTESAENDNQVSQDNADIGMSEMLDSEQA